MAPLWGVVVGAVAVLVYWPGIAGVIPGVEGLAHLKPLRTVDLRIGDLLHSKIAVRAVPEKTPQICVIGITLADLEEHGPMPWRRDIHARLVRRLDAMGARVVAFDIYFPNPTKWDDAFGDACEATGKVILPRWGIFPERLSVSRPWPRKVSGKGISPIAESGRSARSTDGVFRRRMYEAADTLYPRAFQEAHINMFYDDDIVARRVPAAVGPLGETAYYLPLGVVAAMGSLGVKTEDARVANRFLNYGGVRIPLDPSGCILLNYRPFEKWVDTKPQPIRAIESSINWLGKKLKRSPIEFYSYADVLEDRVHPGAFRDAVVLVGQCVWGSREDVHVTPYGSQFGVFVQAVLVYTTLTRRFLVPVSPWATVAAMMILSLALGAFCFRLRYRGSTYVVVVFGCLLVGLGLVLVLCTVGLFRRHGLVVDATPFLMVMGLNLFGGIASSTARVTREADRREREMDLLLAAGERQTAGWPGDESPEYKAIPGAEQMAISASLAVRSPEIVADTFFRTVPCEGCLVHLMEDPLDLSERARTVAAGFSLTALRAQVSGLTEGFADETLAVGRPVLRSRRDPDWPYVNTAPALRTILGVPVVVRGQPLAVVILCNKRVTEDSPERTFSESDIRLVDVLCYQTGALLENARRYRLEYAMFDGFARSMAKAVDVRDPYTHGHSERVAQYSREVARKLGLTAAEQEIVERAATLHDLGKIGVDDAVLNKPGTLSDGESALIQSHAAKGHQILKGAPSFEPLLPGIRCHHERYDGQGYPDGLAGEEIPLIARIIATADAYDAMTSNRKYRKALSSAKARQEMLEGSGSQFDPKVVEAFLRYLDEHESLHNPRGDSQGSESRNQKSEIRD